MRKQLGLLMLFSASLHVSKSPEIFRKIVHGSKYLIFNTKFKLIRIFIIVIKLIPGVPYDGCL